MVVPPPLGGTVGEKRAMLNSFLTLSVYSSLQLSVPLPFRRFCFFTDFNRRRWEGGVGEKGKRVRPLWQPHVASSATQKLSKDPSSVLLSVLSAIVGRRKPVISALKWGVSIRARKKKISKLQKTQTRRVNFCRPFSSCNSYEIHGCIYYFFYLTRHLT